MGSDGLEPSPARVRTGCAAANTLIPCCLLFRRSARRESNPRLPDQKSAVLPLHHDPGTDPRPAFQSWCHHVESPFANVEWPEVESNHRCRRIRATCFRYNTGPQIGVARIELRSLVLPTHAGHHYPSPRINQNGRIRTDGLLAPDQADFQALIRSEASTPYGS
jgi:hypothetical protein